VGIASASEKRREALTRAPERNIRFVDAGL
jgi:hypothetical protein